MNYIDAGELLLGLVILFAAGDALVHGSVAAATRLRIPPILIGLTIVGIGTSAPELVVSVDAALGGAPSIAIGNVVGSNIANILLILGLPALITPIVSGQPFLRRNMIFMLVASGVLAVLVHGGELDRTDGLLLATMIVLYLVYSAVGMMRSRAAQAEIEDEVRSLAPARANTTGILARIGLGLVFLPIGAHFVVDGASGIATSFGISEAVIGLTIIAVGTSLPELAAALAAALRREPAMIMGNVIGSNIFNICAILGITALITNVPVEPRFAALDIWVMLAAAALVAPFAFARRPVSRLAGGVFLTLYIAYAAWLARTAVGA
ncbi:MAG: calcium/sodium antiporter [Alphaproteobacteria bacterium]|nr:calcium/sodium antiporter [Alphaproteobacteria bacterium]